MKTPERIFRDTRKLILKVYKPVLIVIGILLGAWGFTKLVNIGTEFCLRTLGPDVEFVRLEIQERPR